MLFVIWYSTLVRNDPSRAFTKTNSIPFFFFSTAECTTKVLDSSTLSQATCTAVSGYMTAWLPSNRRALSSSESSIYNAIESFIANSYTSDTIVGVSYIPPAATAAAVEDEVVVIAGSKTTSGRASTLQDNTTWEIAPGVGLLALIVSLIALVSLLHVIKKKRSTTITDPVSSSQDIMEMEPEISHEVNSQPPTPKASGGRRFTNNTTVLSDTEDDDCSVTTEDYTPNDYTQDEFITRMASYGSSWGDRMRSLGSLMSFGSGTTSVGTLEKGREEDDMPSEIGEEIEL